MQWRISTQMFQTQFYSKQVSTWTTSCPFIVVGSARCSFECPSGCQSLSTRPVSRTAAIFILMFLYASLFNNFLKSPTMKALNFTRFEEKINKSKDWSVFIDLYLFFNSIHLTPLYRLTSLIKIFKCYDVFSRFF